MAPRARRGGEIAGLKGRIAEALVEAIFQRAGFLVSRAGRESQFPRRVKSRADEFLPDFLLRKPGSETSAGWPQHRLIPVEVKYRASVEEFLRSQGDELLTQAGERWPELCIVLVTDQPVPGRSCFQVIDLAARQPGEPIVSVDLHEVPHLDVYPTTVREYEGLVRQIFPLLRLGPGAERAPGGAR